MKKIIYYQDELNDDFADANFKEQNLTNYTYIHTSKLFKVFSSILYRLIAVPIAFLYSKIVYGIKFENKKVLKKYKKDGYYIYANHTQMILDAFVPAISNRKKPYIVINSANLSIPILGKLLPMLGGIPVPNDKQSSNNFIKAIKNIEEMGNPIVIYPEAHLWPYYTKIRNFSDKSFRYPVKSNKPVFSYTTTYQKRKFRKLPKITVFIDGPFYPDNSLEGKDAQKNLRDKVYETMNERCKLSNIEYIQYRKQEETG